ncbi:hypothetical protein LMB75_07130 [Limosilactobacillus reuteri]|uniref:hypothetical protein n=1 Tax=Limosilactobacillus reuteri TaxID=1598 RepID=UPI001E564932|nr:hypothetical protein [Limosilactobacillus reuteri]MCC4405867.1 hypothetical protein [Limosilactobacillus reuteri]
MNEFYKQRLKRMQKVLAHNLYNVNLILSDGAYDYDIARAMTYLLDDLDNQSDFKQDAKEVETEAYHLAERKKLIHE